MRKEQRVSRTAVTRPLIREASRERLRQTFNAGQKDLQKLRRNLRGPFQHRRRGIDGPGTITRIAHRQAALLRQGSREPARATGQLRQRANRALGRELRRLPHYFFYIWHSSVF